jgi:hypothetical protein
VVEKAFQVEVVVKVGFQVMVKKGSNESNGAQFRWIVELSELLHEKGFNFFN